MGANLQRICAARTEKVMDQHPSSAVTGANFTSACSETRAVLYTVKASTACTGWCPTLNRINNDKQNSPYF